jgi:inositol phosphorylceramide mannosyltransferase catalytic subunit
MAQRIPTRVIQTGKSRDLPLLAKSAVANLQCLNPSFEYIFFDDADVEAFIDDEFPQYRETFDNFRFKIQKYDFFRYLAVYRMGGFYFDTDVFLAQGLESLLAHSCVFAFEELTLSRHLRRRHQMDWELGNYAFGAAAGHPFMEVIIQNCLRAQRDPGWVEPMMQGIPWLFRSDFHVLNTTGPGLVSRTYAENAEAARQVHVLFPDDVCDERTWHQFGNYGVHLMEGSWRTRGNYFRRRFADRWEAWARNRGLAESRKSGKTRNPSRVSGFEFRVEEKTKGEPVIH